MPRSFNHEEPCDGCHKPYWPLVLSSASNRWLCQTCAWKERGRTYRPGYPCESFTQDPLMPSYDVCACCGCHSSAHTKGKVILDPEADVGIDP